MATVKEVMDKAARGCSVTPPNSWVTTTTLTYMELKDFLTETVDELLDRIDWPAPITKDEVITGNGDESYPLPSDFKRLTRDPFTIYETTTTRRPGIPVNTNGDWTYLKQIGVAGGDRYYRLTGDEDEGFEISFFQLLGTGSSLTVSYVSKNWLRQSGIEGDQWTEPGATLLLPRKLVEMGVIWRFRRRKGMPFQDRMNEYEANVARIANDRRGIRRINMTGEGGSLNPFNIPVPDFIPPG